MNRFIILIALLYLTISCKKENNLIANPQQQIALTPTVCYDTLSFVERLEYQNWQIDTIIAKSWAAAHDTSKPQEYYPTQIYTGDSLDIFYYKIDGPYYFFGSGNSISQGPFPSNSNSVNQVDSLHFRYNISSSNGTVQMNLVYIDSLSMRVLINWPWQEPHAPYAPYTKSEQELVLSRANVPNCK